VTAKNQLKERQAAYASFNDAVLADLASFCRANETTFHLDQRVTDMLNGRREVYLRIKDHLDLSFDQLWEKYK